MTQPTPYSPITDFSADEVANTGGRSTVRTAALDAELTAVAINLTGLNTNIALNQRDDGEIRDERVKLHTLSANVKALLAAGQGLPRGVWLTATAYAVRDIVTQGGNTYLAAVAHTSGTFATDLAAAKWLLLTLGATTAAASIPFTPTATIAASNVQAAIEEADTEGRAISAAALASAAALSLDLADTSSTAKGDALIGVKKTISGAVAQTQHQENDRRITVLDFMTDAQRADFLAKAYVLDLSAPLNVATAACAAAGVKLWGAAGGARIGSTLVITCNADLHEVNVKFDASAFSPAVRIGPTSGYLFDATIVAPFVINTAKVGAGWGTFSTSIGIEIANTYQSRLTIPSIYNCGDGLSIGGYAGVGCVYNRIELGVLFGNKRNLVLLPKSTSGWCNQNIFIGGRLGYSSSEGVTVAGTRHIYIGAQAGVTVGSPNGNTFIGQSIEGDEPEYHLDIEGAYNQFINSRLETSATRGAAAVRFYSQNAGDTTSNSIIGGYDARGITYTFAGASSPNNIRIDAKGANCWDFSGSGYSITNRSGSSEANPHLQGFPSSVAPIGKSDTATDWTYRLHADGLSIKSTGDSYSRLKLDSSGFMYLGRGASAATGYLRAGIGAEVYVAAALLPEADNTRNLGAGGQRWGTVYAATGAINTSDERTKQDIGEIPNEWLSAWAEVEWQRFRFRDAVATKGSGARWHFGLVAQRVKETFERHGIDPFAIGLLCWDKWDARPEDGIEAGELYGIRYDEAMALECAYLRSKIIA